MSSPIDRAVNALKESLNATSAGDGIFSIEATFDDDDLRDAICSVLEAFREPSEAMQAAAIRHVGGDKSVLGTWEEMIDAAIAERR